MGAALMVARCRPRLAQKWPPAALRSCNKTPQSFLLTPQVPRGTGGLSMAVKYDGFVVSLYVQAIWGRVAPRMATVSGVFITIV